MATATKKSRSEAAQKAADTRLLRQHEVNISVPRERLVAATDTNSTEESEPEVQSNDESTDSPAE